MRKLIDIQIRSRKGAENFRSKNPWSAISVSTDPKDFPVINTENRIGLLQLSFWDICGTHTLEEGAKVPDLLKNKLFKAEQAEQILDFVDKVLPETETMLIHCEMGLCRSPAIAAAISNILWGPETERMYFNRFEPNRYVYRMILDVYNKRQG